MLWSLDIDFIEIYVGRNNVEKLQSDKIMVLIKLLLRNSAVYLLLCKNWIGTVFAFRIFCNAVYANKYNINVNHFDNDISSTRQFIRNSKYQFIL